MQAGVDWLLAQRAAGVSVPRPLPTSDGDQLVTECDPPVIALDYERSAGRHLPPEDRWDDGVCTAAKRIRDRAAASHEAVPLAALRRHSGA